MISGCRTGGSAGSGHAHDGFDSSPRAEPLQDVLDVFPNRVG
jgi:hypothetical protein